MGKCEVLNLKFMLVIPAIMGQRNHLCITSLVIDMHLETHDVPEDEGADDDGSKQKCSAAEG